MNTEEIEKIPNYGLVNDPERKAERKHKAHEYADPKTKVLKTYCRIHDSFEAGYLSGSLTEYERATDQLKQRDETIKELKEEKKELYEALDDVFYQWGTNEWSYDLRKKVLTALRKKLIED